MKALGSALFVIGILATLTGLIWVGQGTGYFPYPATSFMVAQTPWTYRGLALAIAGIISIVAGHRIRNRGAKGHS
jgi:membrane protein implicated in regulation of membrane protease activity